MAERTDNISEGARWPGPDQLDQMGDRYVSAGRAGNCTPEQPNAWIVIKRGLPREMA